MIFAEAATGGVLEEKVFLEISQKLQNTCARVSFLIKLQASGLRSLPYISNIFQF